MTIITNTFNKWYRNDVDNSDEENVASSTQWCKSVWNSGGHRADPEDLLGVGLCPSPEKNMNFSPEITCFGAF